MTVSNSRPFAACNVISLTASAPSSSDRVSAEISSEMPSKNSPSPSCPVAFVFVAGLTTAPSESSDSTALGSLAMDTSSLMYPTRSSPFSMSAT